MILLETSGAPPYQKLASLALEGEATDLLLKNGREEAAHAHRLLRAIEISTGDPNARRESVCRASPARRTHTRTAGGS